jgi:hypothetical protein
LLLIGMEKLLFLRRHILSMTNPTLLKTQAASQSAFILGQLYSTMDKVILAKINMADNTIATLLAYFSHKT